MAMWWRSVDVLDSLEPQENSVVSRVIQAIGLFGEMSIEDSLEETESFYGDTKEDLDANGTDGEDNKRVAGTTHQEADKTKTEVKELPNDNWPRVIKEEKPLKEESEKEREVEEQNEAQNDEKKFEAQIGQEGTLTDNEENVREGNRRINKEGDRVEDFNKEEGERKKKEGVCMDGESKKAVETVDNEKEREIDVVGREENMRKGAEREGDVEEAGKKQRAEALDERPAGEGEQEIREDDIEENGEREQSLREAKESKVSKEVEKREAGESELNKEGEKREAGESEVNKEVEKREAGESEVNKEVEKREAGESEVNKEVEKREAGESEVNKEGEKREAGESEVNKEVEKRGAGEAEVNKELEKREAGESEVNKEVEKREAGESEVNKEVEKRGAGEAEEDKTARGGSGEREKRREGENEEVGGELDTGNKIDKREDDGVEKEKWEEQEQGEQVKGENGVGAKHGVEEEGEVVRGTQLRGEGSRQEETDKEAPEKSAAERKGEKQTDKEENGDLQSVPNEDDVPADLLPTNHSIQLDPSLVLSLPFPWRDTEFSADVSVVKDDGDPRGGHKDEDPGAPNNASAVDNGPNTKAAAKSHSGRPFSTLLDNNNGGGGLLSPRGLTVVHIGSDTVDPAVAKTTASSTAPLVTAEEVPAGGTETPSEPGNGDLVTWTRPKTEQPSEGPRASAAASVTSPQPIEHLSFLEALSEGPDVERHFSSAPPAGDKDFPPKVKEEFCSSLPAKTLLPMDDIGQSGMGAEKGDKEERPANREPTSSAPKDKEAVMKNEKDQRREETWDPRMEHCDLDAATDERNASNHQTSKYRTVSIRNIRRGNTKQRIDEFESMMNL